ERIQFLDQVIQKAIAVDLDVILDFHPNPQYTHQLIANGQAAEKYLRLWGQIADHYGAMNPDRIVLEVMNEISVNDLYSWSGLLQQSIQVIRHHAPNSTILVQGAGYSDIWDLVELPVLPDANLIYDFHYYEPHIFTHQGATWGLDYWLDVRNLPFPATEKGVSEVIEHTDSVETRWRLLQYKEDHWDADRIASDIEFAAKWAHERNVPLMCDDLSCAMSSASTATSPCRRIAGVGSLRPAPLSRRTTSAGPCGITKADSAWSTRRTAVCAMTTWFCAAWG
ncbi:MAG: cellulase family glycosylhydrolase, partial [Terracidiphilus sp.]